MILMRRFRTDDLLKTFTLVNQPGIQEDIHFARWAEFASQHLALTFADEHGTILACCGVIPYSPIRGEVWMTLSEAGQEYGITVVRCAKSMLQAFHNHGYIRLEALIPTQWAGARRFVQALGFTEESYMPYATPLGEDGIMYRHLQEQDHGLWE